MEGQGTQPMGRDTSEYTCLKYPPPKGPDLTPAFGAQNCRTSVGKEEGHPPPPRGSKPPTPPLYCIPVHGLSA